MAQASGEGGTGAAAENTEPLFDVVVKVPPNISLEEIDAKARAAGVAPERVEALMKALRNLPQVRIGAGVPKQRADAARETFTRAGLLVIITPLLGLQAKVDTPTDGRHQCPGCDQRVVLSEHRQCPECGVYVDKITEEDILRRKLLRQERAKLDFQTARDAKNAEQKTRESMEAALREKIREELEEEYGLRDRRGGLLTSRPVLAGLALALVAAAFVGGRGSSGAWPWTASAAQPQSKSAAPGADPDKLMESLGPKAEGAPAAAGTAGTATGDADIDDPLIRQAGGERIGAKGLTVEQAVAAAQALAKAGGNSTAERALAGGQAGAP
ncbi:MAG: hypothetical protein JWP41_1128, partial [Ramlibacter sp.]|nr:hypothetical protein [Ramlibacter sp.]